MRHTLPIFLFVVGIAFTTVGGLLGLAIYLADSSSEPASVAGPSADLQGYDVDGVVFSHTDSRADVRCWTALGGGIDCIPCSQLSADACAPMTTSAVDCGE